MAAPINEKGTPAHAGVVSSFESASSLEKSPEKAFADFWAHIGDLENTPPLESPEALTGQEPQSPLEGRNVAQINSRPQAAQDDEEGKAEKAESSSENDEGWFKKHGKTLSICAATALAVAGIFAFCFASAMVITGFCWWKVSITVLAGTTSLVGCSLITHYSIISRK